MYDQPRTGPSNVTITKIGNVSISGLTVTGPTAYTQETVKADVVVTSGRWYYEVKVLLTGECRIGWCVPSFDKNGGDSWAYSSTQKKYRNGAQSRYGNNWRIGQIIGVALDFDSRELTFYQDGSSLGKAFISSEFGTTQALSPFGLFGRTSKVQFNFGETPFVHPIDDFQPLHLFLSEKEIVELRSLFDKYRKISVDADEEELSASAALENLIYGDGFTTYSKDLGIKDDNDPSMFIVSWKLGCETGWEITLDEWLDGWTREGAYNIKTMEKKLAEWTEDINKTESKFKDCYCFIFDYLKGEARVIDFEVAKIVWGIVIKPKGWPLFDKWIAYLEKTKCKAISGDEWRQFLEFVQAFPKGDLKNYDTEDSAWPLKIDEFVSELSGGEKDSAGSTESSEED